MALFSKRSLEGYFMVDHRASGMPVDVPDAGPMPVGNQAMFESATITCSHCQKVLILNPGRTRERGYCGKCDHYICDQCESVRAQTGECKTFKQIMDEVEAAVLKKPRLII